MGSKKRNITLTSEELENTETNTFFISEIVSGALKEALGDELGKSLKYTWSIEIEFETEDE